MSKLLCPLQLMGLRAAGNFTPDLFDVYGEAVSCRKDCALACSYDDDKEEWNCGLSNRGSAPIRFSSDEDE